VNISFPSLALLYGPSLAMGVGSVLRNRKITDKAFHRSQA
jgi:hypothetical protein